MAKVSVLMPVYNQSTFVKCAILSLLRQSYEGWELIIIDDGSTDSLYEALADFSGNPRIRIFRNESNQGLGCALNRGIAEVRGTLIAYLPADDIWFENHLQEMVTTLEREDADLVYSGIVHNIGNHGGENATQQAAGKIDGQTLQLVQVMHRKTEDRWVERSELVTDDLDRMFWTEYRNNHPKTAETKSVSCEWFSHTFQRHRILNDRTGGGIYMYRTHYGVKEPLRYHSSVGNLIDERSHYEILRSRCPVPVNTGKGLKILLVGELAFNPERMLALEERGHKLYGLWINNPLSYNTVGPLQFGNVEDIPFDGWEKRIEEIKPDVIYAMLNFKAVELAHHVLTRRPKNIPFVWHFKEGPFFCRTYGLWNKLIDLYEQCDGAVYTNERMRQWFDMFLRRKPPHSIVIDGDLPSRHWFTDDRKPLLSDSDGEIHTVLAGRVFGISSEDIETLANQHIHIHIYGDITQNAMRKMLDEACALAPGYVHLHPNCPAENWVSEFSQYDAGWLHYYQSHNHGDLLRANWVDINSPARMSTYAMPGIPMIMHDNTGHIVHHQEYLQSLDMAVTTDTFATLGERFSDKQINKKLRDNAWNNRFKFCFDSYADELITLFQTIKN